VLCHLSTDFVLQTAYGERHQFYLSTVGNDGVNDGHNCTNYFTQHVSDLEDDGWLATTTAIPTGDQYIPPVVTVTSPDGTTMQFPSTEGSAGAVPTTATDRNGNQVTWSLPYTPQALTITDSLGRQVLTTNGFAQATDTISAADKGGLGPSGSAW